MKLTKAEYDALPESLKGMFKAEGEGYSPKFVSEDDVAGLKSQNEKLLNEKREAKARAEEIERQRVADEEKRIKETGNIEALEKSYQEKLAKLQGDFDSYKGNSEKQLHGLLVKKEAQALASRLGGGATDELFLPHILSRLTVEAGEDGPRTRILDKDGKPSAASMDDLYSEFASNKAFAPAVAKTNASGAQGARMTMVEPQQQQQQRPPMLGANSLTARALELARQGDGE